MDLMYLLPTAKIKECALSKVVLVVEDSLSMRHVITTTLVSGGYKVHEANNGIEALEVLSKKKVNIVISDVNMPEMDGISLVKKIKQLSEYKFLPIIMLTTETSRSKIEEGKAAGAKAWIVKPFDPKQLLHSVSILIGTIGN